MSMLKLRGHIKIRDIYGEFTESSIGPMGRH
jgi:hypothetical protein